MSVMNNTKTHYLRNDVPTFLCLILNKMGFSNLKITAIRPCILGLILLTSLLFSVEGFGQPVPCEYNNVDDPTYVAPRAVVTGLPVYLEIDVRNFDNTVDNDFCIGNSGPNDTDGGCGTFIFTNLIY